MVFPYLLTILFSACLFSMFEEVTGMVFKFEENFRFKLKFCCRCCQKQGFHTDVYGGKIICIACENKGYQELEVGEYEKKRLKEE